MAEIRSIGVRLRDGQPPEFFVNGEPWELTEYDTTAAYKSDEITIVEGRRGGPNGQLCGVPLNILESPGFLDDIVRMTAPERGPSLDEFRKAFEE